MVLQIHALAHIVSTMIIQSHFEPYLDKSGPVETRPIALVAMVLLLQ